MEIDVFEVETKLQLLAMNFSNSYFSSMLDQYQVVFKNSNVVEEMETLDILSVKLYNRKPSINIKSDLQLLSSILENYTYLITVFKTITNVKTLSPKFKRYDMIKYLQDWCKKSVEVDIKSIVQEALKELQQEIGELHPNISNIKSGVDFMVSRFTSHDNVAPAKESKEDIKLRLKTLWGIPSQ